MVRTSWQERETVVLVCLLKEKRVHDFESCLLFGGVGLGYIGCMYLNSETLDGLASGQGGETEHCMFVCASEPKGTYKLEHENEEEDVGEAERRRRGMLKRKERTEKG